MSANAHTFYSRDFWQAAYIVMKGVPVESIEVLGRTNQVIIWFPDDAQYRTYQIGNEYSRADSLSVDIVAYRAAYRRVFSLVSDARRAAREEAEVAG